MTHLHLQGLPCSPLLVGAWDSDTLAAWEGPLFPVPPFPDLLLLFLVRGDPRGAGVGPSVDGFHKHVHHVRTPLKSEHLSPRSLPHRPPGWRACVPGFGGLPTPGAPGLQEGLCAQPPRLQCPVGSRKSQGPNGELTPLTGK